MSWPPRCSSRCRAPSSSGSAIASRSRRSTYRPTTPRCRSRFAMPSRARRNPAWSIFHGASDVDGQYVCQDERRRVLVAESSLDGIDFIEVAATPASPPPHAQPKKEQGRLVVHCFKTVAGPLTTDNVRIEGGERITGIRAVMVGVKPAPDNNQILVDVSEPGDYSTYTLRLVANLHSADPPPGFDQVLSTISFSFKVDCPSDFDCQPVTACPPEPLDQPSIDYLARDYASFRRLMLDRLAL